MNNKLILAAVAAAVAGYLWKQHKAKQRAHLTLVKG